MIEIAYVLKSLVMHEPQTLNELFQQLSFGQFVGGISFFVTLIFMIILASTGTLTLDSKVDDFIEEAKRRGNVVKAHRTSLLMKDTGEDKKLKDRQYTGVYEFELNGKRKKETVVLLANKPPVEINIYYSDKNGKYMTDYHKRTTLKSVFIILLPLIVAVSVAIILGG